jgi:predicted O-methyltransferase YrrM
MPANRSLDELIATLRSFQESRTLLTALELDLFSLLDEGSTGAVVASQAGTDARATEMLLNALVALGALEKEGEVFRCTAASRSFATARGELMHTVRKWNSWSTLTDCVRTGTTAKSPEGKRDEAATEHFIGAMHARAQRVAAPLAAFIGTKGPTRMLDLGGGAATFAIAFAQANPLLQAEVLDLETVVPIAQRHIQEAGLTARVTTRVGDLRSSELGTGYDLLLASAVCHILGEAENRDLLQRCACALNPGGRLVIREFILDPDRTGPPEAALFALNMLVGTARGNVYTEAEYRAWLQAAGFGTVTRRRNGEDLLIAVMAERR